MPTETEQGKWDKPQDVDDLTLTFPAHVCGVLLPSRDELPELYQRDWHRSDNYWCNVACVWFYKGMGKNTVFDVNEGIDPNKALRHLQACLRSFEPSHEEKIGGVGYLMSLWFDSVEIDDYVKETSDDGPGGQPTAECGGGSGDSEQATQDRDGGPQAEDDENRQRDGADPR